MTFCVTLAASMAARLGPTQMAAFQVCLQVWLATSLLADGLAVAGQVGLSFFSNMPLFKYLCIVKFVYWLVMHCFRRAFSYFAGNTCKCFRKE